MFFTTFLNALPGAVAQGLIWGIMAIGVYITYKVLDVADLTVDGSMCTGAAVCVMLMTNGCPMWLALLASLVAGMLAGLLTGIFHTIMGIPALLAGILSQLSLYSINLKILADKANQPISWRNYYLLVSLNDVKSPPVAVKDGTLVFNPIFITAILIAVIIYLIYWFMGREIGCALRATGANQNMSRAQGINTKFTTVLGLMMSNAIVAFSGALLAQYQGFADINMGRGAIVIGLAAVIIGGVIFDKIFHNFALKLVSVAIGGIIYYIVLQIVITLGFDTNLLKLLSAIVVGVFLAIPFWKKRFFTKVKGVK
ncbi:MAG: ABC transporter permease [Parasporobacterium sp.]|nr:ABC transporter permease [Parasporobacterium sp.]